MGATVSDVTELARSCFYCDLSVDTSQKGVDQGDRNGAFIIMFDASGTGNKLVKVQNP